jgi:hypothetical protein
VIWWRPPVKCREWWDTELARKWNVTQYMGRMWARHLAPIPHMPAENDVDHLTW